MNKVFLIGRLTRDPELRYTSSNMATCRMNLAVDRDFVRQGEERQADFINLVAFAQRAETMQKFLVKGSQIAVDGRIQTGSYDGQDGKKVYTTDVIVDNFQFLDKRGTVNSTDNEIPTESKTETKTPDIFGDFGANVTVNDEDLPF